MMKKLRFPALLMAALLLTACTGLISGPTAAPTVEVTAQPTAEATAEPIADATAALSVEPTLSFKSEEYPRIDGSTATLPLAYAVRSALTGESLEQSEENTRFTTTGPAWINLQENQADLLIVYEASQPIQEQLAARGIKLEKKEIGLDALVMLCNEGNPVESLTHQQLLDIYSGKITNWKDVGGVDKEILAFQRDENSGSQTLMKKLVMGDVAMMQAPTELMPDAMDMLLNGLAEYNNSANALGYSVYFYVANMYTRSGVKLLAIDGVPPTNETIANGTYRYLNPFYAVIRADEPADSPARKLYEWLTGPEGAAAVEQNGYVPAGK